MDQYSQEMPDYEGPVFTEDKELDEELALEERLASQRSASDKKHREANMDKRRDYMRRYMADRRKK